MSEELVINVTPRETRVAVVENGVVQELFVERASKRGLVGNIYMGKVVRVLPGMQAAFVECGLQRAAFLHVSDMAPLKLKEKLEEDKQLTDEEILKGGPQSPNPETLKTDPLVEYEDICHLLSEGQRVVVQVIKDPIGTKGARLTTRLSLPSRYLVFMPEVDHIGVSARIEEESERDRLKQAIHLSPEKDVGGYIVRTAAEGVTEDEIVSNIIYLKRLWSAIQVKIKAARFGDLIHEDLPLVLRALRDSVNPNTERVRIDEQKAFEKAIDFVEEFVPSLMGRVSLYNNERPIFDIYNIEDEIQKALHRKVSLKSGGYLIFDQTEAMTTIDVNTGAFVGHRNLEETIFKTNLEATQAIGRQLRLRNLGGIIIIDFIDMIDQEHKVQVLLALEKALSRDSAKHNVAEVSALGLVQMTRKRTRESLQHILCEPCKTCDGRGSIKTPETVCNEIFREILRSARTYEAAQSLMVLSSQEVVDRMLDEESDSVTELMDVIGKEVKFQVESLYTQEHFDVVLM